MKHTIEDKICIAECQILDYIRKNMKNIELLPERGDNLTTTYDFSLFGSCFSLMLQSNTKKPMYNVYIYLEKYKGLANKLNCIARLAPHDPLCVYLKDLRELQTNKEIHSCLVDSLEEMKHNKELKRLKQEHKEQKTTKSLFAYIKHFFKH